MRIDAGDTILKNHLEHGKKNASYRSVDIQNEIISICGDVIKADCIKNVKILQAYSILADETADISGKEQLSVGIRYCDKETSNIEEVFLGFAELTALDAKSIATAINEFLTKEDLDPDKCVGLGFDGCSTMSGKEGGVQAILRKKYKKALFFHCSSHKLNLVINDLNALPEIRNTVGAIKDIITFFRESVLRRKLIPNIPKLCETRCSEKYKSIRVFKENFCDIMEALETLSAASKVSFIFSLGLISKYSALLEPTVNVLQSVSLDAVQASQHIGRISKLIKNHRENPEKITEEIFKDASVIAKKIVLDMKSIPRTAERQQHPFECAKSVITLAISTFRASSFSMEIIAKADNLSSAMQFLMYVFINFNFEKDRSADATEAGMAKKILQAVTISLKLEDEK
ncbi:uncharacterized protein LOC126748462 [Anthonomus grandis grandis]|uniref:uncharacterized protein LOC126748462 n=1 Tax=Anthonomus grandis grandis TaxID=2921223 RepID=UPI002166ADBF|nr:uncharacterized protein LOC126748462 [Anthonomus grandis grandis]